MRHGAIILALGMGWFAGILGGLAAILLPVHIAFLELIIDPACTMIIEAEEAKPKVV